MMGGNEVDNDRPCTACQRSEWEDEENPFVFCDGPDCTAAWHLFCAGDLELPEEHEDWLCPTCRMSEPRSAAERVTFNAAARPSVDKQSVRAKHGLLDGGRPDPADVPRLLSAATTDETKKKKERVLRTFHEMCREIGRQVDENTIITYASWRVKNLIAAKTIKQEVGIICAAYPGVHIEPRRLQEIDRAIVRLADVPRKEKLPITPDELRKLHDAIWQHTPGGKASERSVLSFRTRDWTFFLLAFVTMARGEELAKLRWSHVHLKWLLADGDVIETQIGQGLAGLEEKGVLAGAVVHVIDSKSDQGGEGRPVQVYYDAQADEHDCPVKMLLALHALKRTDQEFVFAETRERLPATGLTEGTFRTKLKDYCSFLRPERLEKLALHSFRKGGATTAKAAGATLEEIKGHAGWKSDEVPALHYLYESDQALLDVSKKVTHAFKKSRR